MLHFRKASKKDIDILDTVLLEGSYTESNFALAINRDKDTHLAYANKEVNEIIEKTAQEEHIKYKKGYYDGDVNHNKKCHGFGKRTYSTGDYYEGELRDGNRHGHGKQTYSNGNYYEGEWHDDNRHGHGKYVYKDGTYYEGEWHDDNRHGLGKYVYKDGTYYEGEWHEKKDADANAISLSLKMLE